MNPITETKVDQLSKAGSFWSSQLREKKDLNLIRGIARLTDMTPAWNFPDYPQAIYGNKDFMRVRTNFTLDIAGQIGSLEVDWDAHGLENGSRVGILPKHIVDPLSQTSRVTYIEDGQLNILYEDNRFLLFPISEGFGHTAWYEFIPREPVFYVDLVTTEINPSAILSDDGPLVSGIDFHNAGNLLFFKEDPNILFPSGYMRILRADVVNLNPSSYVQSVDPTPGTGLWTSRYIRGKQSLPVFEAALNELGGLTVFDRDFSPISGYDLYQDFTLYNDDLGRMVVPQFHQRLEVGKTYPKGFIPGKAIECRSWSTHGDRWWQGVQWKPGAALKGMFGFLEVEVPNATIRLQANETDQLYFYLSGTKEQVDAWNEVRWYYENQADYNLSQTLIDEHSLSPGDSIYVNGLDFFMENFFKWNGLVVTINQDALYPDSYASILNFIENNRPINVVTIIN